ncbi:MAG: energy-coupling factor transporter ATPase [Oscillospiraceae bacterium]|jgi:energy-coupling factor transport system ATP-binding protein|nr:energy-coupling factor transporter ATPase [Oscillospiraceae bacterium]MDD3261452.1 energy-coupling factor transporter ATPase [Oscillospiraceae bacterium]
MAAVSGKDISFTYESESTVQQALSEVSLAIQQGELAAILGANGSGKSTLVKLLNALLPLQQGTLTVAGIDVREESRIWQLRRRCGMVFQNPDNQFVSSVVKEDIAFGLENYEVPRREIPEKVRTALQMVGMEGFEERAPHALSGGQKQRIALAGVLALDPDILILDEATAMLDPQGRREVLETVQRLHEKAHKTILMISHYIEEAIFADRVFLMKHGHILASGTPREILTDQKQMAAAGLVPPVPVRLYYDLHKRGIRLSHCPLTNEELVKEICRLR